MYGPRLSLSVSEMVAFSCPAKPVRCGGCSRNEVRYQQLVVGKLGIQRPQGLGSGLQPKTATRFDGQGSSSGRQTLHSAVQRLNGQLSSISRSEQYNSNGSHEPADDGSLKIIMLLSLSLGLMLLPWMSRHPEFLLAPVLLAFTPVVGSGARSVLREVAGGVLATLRLSLGMLIHGNEHHQLPGSVQSEQNHHHHHTSSGGSHHAQHQQQPYNQPPPAGPYSPWPKQQPPGIGSIDGGYHPPQQQQQAGFGPYPSLLQPQQQPQQQHSAPAGPHSPWPHPIYTPVAWDLGPAAAAAAAPGPQSSPVGSPEGSPASSPSASHSSLDVDSDWGVSGDDWEHPHMHHADPASQQHLQQVLAADQRVEQELCTAAAAAFKASRGGSTATRNSRLLNSRNHRVNKQRNTGSSDNTAASMDTMVDHTSEVRQALPDGSVQHHGHGHHIRDPRTLSKEAKQLLYGHHDHHQ